MAGITFIRLTCDHGGCPDWTQKEARTITEARKLAKKDRWGTVRTPQGFKDFCPRHRPAVKR